MSALSSQACCGIDRHKCVALSCPVGVTIREFCWYFYPLEGWETLKRWNWSAAAGWLLQQQSHINSLNWFLGLKGVEATADSPHLSINFPGYVLISAVEPLLLCRRSSAEAPVMCSCAASWALKRLTRTLNSVFPFSGKWEELVGFFQLLRKICEASKERQTLRTTLPHGPRVEASELYFTSFPVSYGKWSSSYYQM